MHLPTQVMAHYDLMSEFGVSLAQEDREAAAGLDGEVSGICGTCGWCACVHVYPSMRGMEHLKVLLSAT